MTHDVSVEILDDAKLDVPRLRDTELIREALRVALSLKTEPYRGEKLREKSNLRPLARADCRKVKFDHPDRSARARPRFRYRLVYRIEPHEGSPSTIVIMAVGPKPDAYRDATARAARRLREQAVRLRKR